MLYFATQSIFMLKGLETFKKGIKYNNQHSNRTSTHRLRVNFFPNHRPLGTVELFPLYNKY